TPLRSAFSTLFPYTTLFRSKSALIYPIILICVAVTSVMILLVFVVPQFQQTFAQAGKALPVPTQVVIFVGTGLRKYWWLLIAVRSEEHTSELQSRVDLVCRL